jgi:tetratricopeptide (TPR) repeat protein
MLDEFPQRVSDSLRSIDREELSRGGRAYYDLLKVISDDKTYVNFTSDSLISTVSDYYRSSDPQNKNFIRALAYQGIVRTRLGVKDSTVYEPLKEAERLFSARPDTDPSLGYMINYFLGNIHYNSRNFISANEYFQNALSFARVESDSIHVFDTFLALYWNEMGQKNFDKSSFYLDTILTYFKKLPGKDYFVLNAQSTYYDITGQLEKALEIEKKQLELVKNQKEVIDLSRLYFVISDRFVGLEQLDSALYYGEMAIEMIQDSTYRQNYLYYQNVAQIAEKRGDFALSNYYLKKSIELLNQSLTERLDVQIAEMEKRYDLAEAENEVLRTREQVSRTIIISLIVILLLFFVAAYSLWMRRNTQLRLLQIEHRMKQQQLQADILKEEAAKRRWLLQLYGNISGRLTFLQNEFEKLADRYVTVNQKVHNEMYRILKSTDADLRDIAKTLVPDDATFTAYTGLKNEEQYFSVNEKLLLMLLACDADNRQLATFLNTSVDSIRVRKSQLKKKMSEKGLDTYLFPD